MGKRRKVEEIERKNRRGDVIGSSAKYEIVYDSIKLDVPTVVFWVLLFIALGIAIGRRF
jgi:hypothetical protein